MKISHLVFLIISTAITVLVFPSGNFVESRPDMINYFFITYLIWMCASGLCYYFINFFIIKNSIDYAFRIYLGIVAIICILLGIINEVMITGGISVLLCLINFIVFGILGAMGFWLARIVMSFFVNENVIIHIPFAMKLNNDNKRSYARKKYRKMLCLQ